MVALPLSEVFYKEEDIENALHSEGKQRESCNGEMMRNGRANASGQQVEALIEET